MKIVLLLLIGVILSAGNIKIAVAANVSYAIEDLKAEFNTLYPDIKVQVTLGSSGKLTAQIKNGAPYQLFMSANMRYPKSLYADKIAITKPKVYAQGGLAFLSSKKRDFSKGINLLKDKKISKIAIANPKTAPYGKATLEALTNAKIYNDIKSKIVYGESISQTLTFTLRATDIGIVAKSLLFSPRMAKFKKGINWSELDSSLYTPISQGIVMLKDNRDVELFYNFILSQKAKKILKNFGYIVE
jgi:molybdate transport system substrate-binding protein